MGSIIAACSGSSTGNGSNPNPGSDGSTTPSGDAGAPVTCASSTLNILFSPMYSAFIPGSTAHTFQIPAVLDDGSQATWGSDNPSIVAQMPDSTTGGTMITVTGTGTVNIIATKSDGTCGSAPLNITTTFTEADWQIGSSRYNDGVALHVGGGGGGGGFEGGRPEGGFGGGGMFNSEAGSFLEQEGGTACTNCHGPTGNSGPPFNFTNVSHTPEQTGGFSDDQLIQIVLDGIVPDGGYFDPNVIIPDASADPTGTQQAKAYKLWQSFHRWGAAYGGDITQDEQNGVIVYLRSLQPEPQNGASDFGGGFGDGGRHHHDGGGFGQMDTGAGPTPDSGGGSDATGD